MRVVITVSLRSEMLWAIRQPDGRVIECRLLQPDESDFDVVLLVDGERTHTRRCLTRVSAELEGNAMHARVIAAVGGVPVMARQPRRDV
jgi:hypothetical protein